MTLTAHADAVLVMTKGANDTIWTGSLNGQLLQWNAKTGSLLSSADFVLRSAWSGRVLPVYSVHILPEVELFVIYGVMALVLAFKPYGLFAGPEVRKI